MLPLILDLKRKRITTNKNSEASRGRQFEARSSTLTVCIILEVSEFEIMATINARIAKLETQLRMNNSIPLKLLAGSGIELIFHGTINGRKVKTGMEDWSEEEANEFLNDDILPAGKPIKYEWA